MKYFLLGLLKLAFFPIFFIGFWIMSGITILLFIGGRPDDVNTPIAWWIESYLEYGKRWAAKGNNK